MRYVLQLIPIGLLWGFTFFIIWYRKKLPDGTFKTVLKVFVTLLMSLGIVSCLMLALFFIFD